MNNKVVSGSFLENGAMVLLVSEGHSLWGNGCAVVLATRQRQRANGKVQGELVTWVINLETTEAEWGHYFRPDQSQEAAADFLDRASHWRTANEMHSKLVEASRKLATRAEPTTANEHEANEAGNELRHQ